jgi:hypothetical protein
VKNKLLQIAGLTLSLSAFAQTSSQSTIAIEPMSSTPTFRVNVVSRSVSAVNYKHHSGATKLDFAGTDLMPGATGQAKVESKKGYIEIEVEFANLPKPTTFGGEYLTYILWAISPEGRAVNLGEVLVGDNHRSKLDVTTDLQAFALVVTAEPYFAVREPSDMVVTRFAKKPKEQSRRSIPSTTFFNAAATSLLDTNSIRWSSIPSYLWSSSKREMLCALRNRRARRRSPVKAIDTLSH